MENNDTGYICIKKKGEQLEHYLTLNGQGHNLTRNKDEATLFSARKYEGSKKTEAFYLRIYESDQYLDQHSLTGTLFANKVNLTEDLSTIWAWRIQGNEMEAVAMMNINSSQRICFYNNDDNNVYCLFPNRLIQLCKSFSIANVKWEKA